MNKLWISFIIVLVLIGVGTMFYHYYENWSIIDSLYFSTTTMTTVGYGDLHPTSNITKIFTVFYLICSVSVGLYALSYLGKFQHPKLEKALLKTFNNMPIKRLKELRRAFNRKTDIKK